METLLPLLAPILGFFLGTLLFSRVGAWIYGITVALGSEQQEKRKAVLVVVLLHSGPWLMVALVYWAYYVLSRPHAKGWEAFFGAGFAAIPIWLAVTIYLHYRGKRIRARAGGGENAV